MKRTVIITALAVLQLTMLSAIAEAQQVEHPNYFKALGLTGNVKDIGVYTDEIDATDCYDYCTYEFDSQGRLVSYSEAEMVEAAYSWVAFFDSEGLPTHIETQFIDYWTETDEDGNPPITNTRLNIRREEHGPVIKLFIENDEGEKQVKVTRDNKGRIIEVDNIFAGKVYRYLYSDETNVPYNYDGSLAFPQVDMMDGHRIAFPSQNNIPDNPTTFQYGLWQFEVNYLLD